MLDIFKDPEVVQSLAVQTPDQLMLSPEEQAKYVRLEAESIIGSDMGFEDNFEWFTPEDDSEGF